MPPTINVARLADKRAPFPLGLRLSPAADCFMISHSNTLVRLESPGSPIRGAIVISYVQRSRLASSSKSSWSTTPQRLYDSSSRNAVRPFPSPLFLHLPRLLGLLTMASLRINQSLSLKSRMLTCNLLLAAWNPCKSVFGPLLRLRKEEKEGTEAPQPEFKLLADIRLCCNEI
jgi:hypothetical protein